jgi:hypothetical protein
MIPRHLAERVADLQQRQATRRQQRAELDAARTAGLRRRHATKLTHTKEETTMPTADRSPTASRVNAPAGADALSRSNASHTCDVPAGGDAPPRRSGRHAGFPGKADLNLADNALRAGLSKLARDPDPEARRAGARLAQEAIKALLDLSGRAERSSTSFRRMQAAADRLGDKLDRRIAEVLARAEQKGQQP